MTGPMVSVDFIEAYHCLTTGRIVCMRRTSQGLLFQLHEGYVSQDGVRDDIGGTLEI